jgi:hypothetical protein
MRYRIRPMCILMKYRNQPTCDVTRCRNQPACVVTRCRNQPACVMTGCGNQPTCIVTRCRNQPTCIMTKCRNRPTCVVTRYSINLFLSQIVIICFHIRSNSVTKEVFRNCVMMMIQTWQTLNKISVNIDIGLVYFENLWCWQLNKTYSDKSPTVHYPAVRRDNQGNTKQLL